MTTTKTSCSVCGGELESYMRAECHLCGQLYHLNSRQDLPGDDCGVVTLSDTMLGLIYVCNTCIQREQEGASGALDEILTLEEAASFASMPEQELTGAAEAGGLRHRKAGSTYLFQRADLADFIRATRQR